MSEEIAKTAPRPEDCSKIADFYKYLGGNYAIIYESNRSFLEEASSKLAKKYTKNISRKE